MTTYTPNVNRGLPGAFEQTDIETPQTKDDQPGKSSTNTGGHLQALTAPLDAGRTCSAFLPFILIPIVFLFPFLSYASVLFVPIAIFSLFSFLSVCFLSFFCSFFPAVGDFDNDSTALLRLHDLHPLISFLCSFENHGFCFLGTSRLSCPLFAPG